MTEDVLKDACTTRKNVFNYDMSKCPHGQKVQLLNIGGVAVYGTISNEKQALSSGFIAWFPLPIRDREEEKQRNLMSFASSGIKTCKP